jgi:hypothetical protein
MSQVVTKFPSTNQTIVAGWNNPANAYAEDGVNTDASPPNEATKPEQKYGGWNFTTEDIPAGSVITKVEMGCKHYETDPLGYSQYTDLAYVNSQGSKATYGMSKRSGLTWDWKDITSRETSWDLTKLNNGDVRIISRVVSTGGGCYVETKDEKTYVLVKLPYDTYTIRSMSELAIGDLVLIWENQKGMMFSPVERIEVSELVQEEVIEIWSGTINLKPAIKKDVEWTPHETNTKLHPIPAYKKESNRFVGPFVLTAEELHERVLKGEEFWIGHLWYKWQIEMFPIKLTALKTITGKAYKVITAEKKCCIFTKSLTKHESELLNNLGLTLSKQAELGPPFMIEISKTTSYIDAVTLRVTYIPPTAGQFQSIGEGLTSTAVFV